MPVSALSMPGPAPSGDRQAAMATGGGACEGCEDCQDRATGLGACSTDCAQAACVAVHCVAYLPLPSPVFHVGDGRQHARPALPPRYRSHLPGLPHRPPIV